MGQGFRGDPDSSAGFPEFSPEAFEVLFKNGFQVGEAFQVNGKGMFQAGIDVFQQGNDAVAQAVALVMILTVRQVFAPGNSVKFQVGENLPGRGMEQGGG
ncbi:MAG: hypothetical protein LRY55_04710 [Leadbetterella sp.]|nr:hypothetical protein [Leadbetterella sp.]